MRTPLRSLPLLTFGVGVLLLTRRMTSTWGTWVGEYTATMPGDGLVSGDVVATRGITIDATPEEVWPWLVQLGVGRGGFYSYDQVERWAGLDVRSADRVEERWQSLAVGDSVRLSQDVGLTVAQLVPGEHLVLVGADAAEGTGVPFGFSWAFVLRPLHGTGTRLLVRERYATSRWWSRAVAEIVQPVSFVMTARMLRGIRDRAEGG